MRGQGDSKKTLTKTCGNIRRCFTDLDTKRIVQRENFLCVATKGKDGIWKDEDGDPLPVQKVRVLRAPRAAIQAHPTTSRMSEEDRDVSKLVRRVVRERYPELPEE